MADKKVSVKLVRSAVASVKKRSNIDLSCNGSS